VSYEPTRPKWWVTGERQPMPDIVNNWAVHSWMQRVEVILIANKMHEPECSQFKRDEAQRHSGVAYFAVRLSSGSPELTVDGGEQTQ
jgi:hypothetical protein